MDHQSAIGKAIETYLAQHPDASAAEAADWATKTAAGQMTVATVLARNGVKEIAAATVGPLLERRLRRPEPTHALDAPPLLVENDLPDELLHAARAATMDGGDPFGPPCACGQPTATLPRGGRVCLNEECERYEEVYR